MIGNFGNFNGFIRIGEVDVFSGVLCAIESTLFLIVIIIHAFACYKAQTWEEGPAKLLGSDSAPSSNKSLSQIS